MDDVFVLQVVSSFIIGGAYIAFISRISELFGAKIGGVLSGTPSTALVGMTFLAIAEGDVALKNATPGIVVGLSGTMLFLVLYNRARDSKNIAFSAIFGLMGWLTVVAVLRTQELDSILIASVIYALALTSSTFMLSRIKEVSAKSKKMPLAGAIARVIFAGTIVSSVLIASRVAGPFWGGIMSAFPASFMSNIVILEREQGRKFTASVIKYLPISSLSVFCYAVVIGLTAVRIGSFLSILLAFVVSLIAAYAVYAYKSVPRTKPSRL